MKYCVLVLFALAWNIGFAQIELGFKVGLAYTTLDGPSEVNDEGRELESFSMTSGFILGLVLDYPITDLVGVRGEILYSQRNYTQKFEGEGYMVLPPTDAVQIAVGDKRFNLDIINTYIDIPILGYYKFGRFEVHGGFNFGLLVGSRGEGSRTFSGNLVSNNAEINLLEGQILDYNYLSDIPRGFVSGDAIPVTINNETLFVPRSPGAYFDYAPRGRAFTFNYFNRFEVAAIGGLSFELNRGLYICGRMHYGLSDITNNEIDASQAEINGTSLILRNDRDRTFGFNGTIMFMF